MAGLPIKRKREVLTLQMKKEIVIRLDKGEKAVALAKNLTVANLPYLT